MRSILFLLPCSRQRQREHHSGAGARPARHLGPAAQPARPLQQAAQAEAGRGRQHAGVEAGAVVDDLERGLGLIAEQLHGHGPRLRVLADVGERFLRDPVHRHRGRVGQRNVFAIGLEGRGCAAARREVAGQPAQRLDQAGVEHRRPQVVLDPVAGRGGLAQQRLHRLQALVRRTVAQVARQPDQLEAQRGQRRSDVVVHLACQRAPLVLAHLLQVAGQFAQPCLAGSQRVAGEAFAASGGGRVQTFA